MIGLRLHTEDLAKFGQLLLQNGKWNNKQLIPETWIKEATSFKIESNDPSNKTPKEMNDWAQGYSYQMWRGRNNSVRLDGMAGQFVILFPDMDAIVVLTANARNTQKELDLVHSYLVPAIKSGKAIQKNPDSYDELRTKQAALRLKLQTSEVSESGYTSQIGGKEFILGENDYQIQSVYFAFNNSLCSFGIKRSNQVSVIKAGKGDWQMNNTSLPFILSPQRNIPSKSIDANYSVLKPKFRVAACYSWTDKVTLEITTRYVEDNLGEQTIVCRFSEMNGSVAVTISPKSAPGQTGAPGRAAAAVQLRGLMVDLD
jgi:hypothetical protein